MPETVTDNDKEKGGELTLEVFKAMREDKDAKIAALQERIEQLESKEQQEPVSDADPLQEYREEDIKAIESIVGKQVGPLAEAIRAFFGQHSKAETAAMLKSIDGLPEGFTWDDLSGDVEKKMAEAEKSGRVLLPKEALGAVFVEKLGDFVAASKKTTATEREKLLAKKSQVGDLELESLYPGGLAETVPEVKRLPPEIRKDRSATVRHVLDKVISKMAGERQ